MLQSAKTALRVFETIANHEPIGVSEIARRLAISKSTAQRCLTVLHETGWIQVDQNKTVTKWIITSKAFLLGQRVVQRSGFREVAMPFMEKLWDAFQTPIHLAVAEGNKAIMLEQYEKPGPKGMQLPRGAWAPMHVLASGKLFLAYADRKFVDRYIETDLVAVTEHTIAEPEALLAELAKIRSRGWATATDELVVGASAAAAPIVDRDGHVIAALAVTMRTAKFRELLKNNQFTLLVDAAARISHKLEMP